MPDSPEPIDPAIADKVERPICKPRRAFLMPTSQPASNRATEGVRERIESIQKHQVATNISETDKTKAEIAYVLRSSGKKKCKPERAVPVNLGPWWLLLQY